MPDDRDTSREGAKIHVSVFDRMKLVASCKPKNLPANYQQVP
jgi:hypothetical protein